LPIVPITMGINDPGLTTLVTNLADLQGQLSSRGAGEMNPLQGLLAQRVRNTKDGLRETLNGLRRANSLAMTENQKQIAKINSQASSLPVTERQLLGFERKFRLNDELYTFLLEMRSEQQMQKASNMADSEVVDAANEQFSVVVAPSPAKIYFVGLFLGSGFPFLILFLVFIFNKKLKDEDIRGLTNLPIAGNIPRNTQKINTIVFDDPASIIAEAYRLLRSRMQFFTKEVKSPVILITSSMPAEGKSFTAINLASVYSLLGKRTVLVGFDLRKPKLFDDFNLSNERGVSTWLIGQDKIDDIIQQTVHQNLYVITAGPVPPNPSELIALEKTEELILALKEKFDFIVIDSSPIGIVSDTYHLASMADSCILVVRPGRTLRDLFNMTLRELGASGIKGLCLLVNDVKADNLQYGYGEKFGYTNNKKRHKAISILGRKNKG
jgi:tyrosine-protein kinase Etk/Wzc